MPTALVTGANRGIGNQFVHKLRELEFDVISVVRDASKAEDLKNISSVIEADLTSEHAISGIADQVTTLDLLVNNAGVLDESPQASEVGELQGDTFRFHFQVNSIAPVLLMQALVPKMSEGSVICNISSGASQLSVVRGMYAIGYSMSKAALNMAVVRLAQDKAFEKVIVVAMDPGWVRTDMGGPSAPLSPEQSVTNMLRTIGRLGPGSSGLLFSHAGNVMPW